MTPLGQVNYHTLLDVCELEELEVLYWSTLNRVCASISARKMRGLGIVAFESGGFYPRVSTLGFVLRAFQVMNGETDKRNNHEPIRCDGTVPVRTHSPSSPARLAKRADACTSLRLPQPLRYQKAFPPSGTTRGAG